MPVKTYNPSFMETGEVLFQAEFQHGKLLIKLQSNQNYFSSLFITQYHITTLKMTPRAKA